MKLSARIFSLLTTVCLSLIAVPAFAHQNDRDHRDVRDEHSYRDHKREHKSHRRDDAPGQLIDLQPPVPASECLTELHI